jgi:hypothetical protein
MDPVKAAVAWPNGKAYLFQGSTYRRYSSPTGTLEQAGIQISPEWPNLGSTAPDAGFLWGYGKAYFFFGDHYVRYDVKTDTVEADYLPPNPPKALAVWGLATWTDHISATMNWGNGKVYFFRGAEYLRYDIAMDRPDEGYPRPIAGNWPGVWEDGVDAALYTGGEKAYFFRGEEFRQFDIALDDIDASGHVDNLQLEPVPSGTWKPARELTPAEANELLGYLVEHGKLTLGPQTPFAGSWRTGISSPAPSARVVVKPAVIEGVAFHFANSASPQSLLDNVDQRMLAALYRLTRWVNASEPTVHILRHLGIGHGAGPPNDCHNQGRALDFSGLDGTSQGSAFTRDVLANWGNLSGPGPLRLDPSVDRLAHDLFRTVFGFGTYECECNGIGTQNTWPPKEIGDPGGFVIHPDYVDVGPQVLRPAHQNHVHMQVGKTRV